MYRCSWRRQFYAIIVFKLAINKMVINHQPLNDTLITNLFQQPSMPLMSANLTCRDRLDPANHQIERDRHDSGNPNPFPVLPWVVPKDDGEDDTSKIAGCSCDARHDAVGMGVY